MLRRHASRFGRDLRRYGLHFQSGLLAELRLHGGDSSAVRRGVVSGFVRQLGRSDLQNARWKLHRNELRHRRSLGRSRLRIGAACADDVPVNSRHVDRRRGDVFGNFTRDRSFHSGHRDERFALGLGDVQLFVDRPLESHADRDVVHGHMRAAGVIHLERRRRYVHRAGRSGAVWVVGDRERFRRRSFDGFSDLLVFDGWRLVGAGVAFVRERSELPRGLESDGFGRSAARPERFVPLQLVSGPLGRRRGCVHVGALLLRWKDNRGPNVDPVRNGRDDDQHGYAHVRRRSFAVEHPFAAHDVRDRKPDVELRLFSLRNSSRFAS